MDNLNFEKAIQYISKVNGFRLEIIEKDYHMTRILNSVNEHLSQDIVFKGGTLINKVYLNYHRLSEDIDFSYCGYDDLSTRRKRSKAITPIRDKMEFFLELLQLSSKNPKGQGFNNSTQYVFRIQYDSVISSKNENIKFEISMRQKPLIEPITVSLKHFYQDPYTGKDLIDQGNILALSLEECVAEKLKAAISRLKPEIRDYYDLWHFINKKYDFRQKNFLQIVNEKLKFDGYQKNYSFNLGLSEENIEDLTNSIKTSLLPMLRMEDDFDLKFVLNYFNELFQDNKQFDK